MYSLQRMFIEAREPLDNGVHLVLRTALLSALAM
jgi:hypothetical protein